jgi:hypothetical protein
MPFNITLTFSHMHAIWKPQTKDTKPKDSSCKVMKKGWIKEEEEHGIPWRWDVRESK